MPQIEMVRMGLRPEDAERARVVAGHAITRLSPQTAVAMGISENGRVLQQRLAGESGAAFLIAREAGARAGFSISDTSSIGVRHELGRTALTLTAEQGQVREPGLRLTAENPTYNSATLTAQRRLGSFDAALGVTRLQEEATVLGGRFGFAPQGSTSTFIDASLRYHMGSGWAAQGRVRNGWTMLPGGNGFVEGGRMTSDSWSLDLSKRGAFSRNDSLSLRVAQPLRVRAGGYRLNVPVSYDYSDLSVGYQLATYSLAPQGRELDVEAAYWVPLFNGAGSLSAHTYWRRDPGNIEALNDDLGAAVRFSFSF
jgi:hypothetical protein